MSYYKVQMIWFDPVEGSMTDPVEVFDPEDKDMCLINPTVTLDVGEAGSFDFVVPKNHVFYDKFMPYASVAVFEESTCIFVGRLRPPSIDMFGQKTFHAEGALAYLNDVILPPMEMENPITAANYIDQVLDYYDQYASARPDREIYHNMSVTDLANIQIYDPQAWNYQSALDILRSYVFKFCGGYFYVEFDGFDDIELKWRKYLTDPSSQVIQIGVNMLDLTRNGNEIYTAAIASGGQNAEGETAAMLAPVYDAGKATKYGFVCKYLSYPDATVVDALEAYCESFLENMQYDGFTFQASAADQHPINSATGKFLLGQVVNLRADSLGVDARLPITRIVVNLNSAIKDVTVGTPERNSIVVSTAKAQIQQEETEKEMECCSEDKQDKEINGYVIDIDDEGNISTVKVPDAIEFTKSVTTFSSGDVLHYSDYEVTAYYKDGTTEVVTSSCTFNVADGYVFRQTANPRVFIANYTHSSGKKLHVQLLLHVMSVPTEPPTVITGWADWRTAINVVNQAYHDYADAIGRPAYYDMDRYELLLTAPELTNYFAQHNCPVIVLWMSAEFVVFALEKWSDTGEPLRVGDTISLNRPIFMQSFHAYGVTSSSGDYVKITDTWTGAWDLSDFTDTGFWRQYARWYGIFTKTLSGIDVLKSMSTINVEAQ